MATGVKAFDFPLSVRWAGGRLTVASVEGKDDLEVVTPPEFKGEIEGVWSPEDLLVGSVAACFALTFVALAERRAVPLRSLEVAASGRVAQRNDGRFGFTEVTLDVSLATDPGLEQEAKDAAEAAERGCLVAVSLDLPVHLRLEVQTSPTLEAAT